MIIIPDTTRRDRIVSVFECACGIQRQCIGQGGIGCQPQSAAIRTQLETSFFGLTVELGAVRPHPWPFVSVRVKAAIS